MLDEIKWILKELAMPRFNGDLGWDEDRIALINRAETLIHLHQTARKPKWNMVEKLEKEQDYEYLG